MDRQKFIDMPCKVCDVGKIHDHNMCEACYLDYIDQVAFFAHRKMTMVTPEQHIYMTRAMKIGWGDVLKKKNEATSVY